VRWILQMVACHSGNTRNIVRLWQGVPVMEASLPHGDTSGEEAESCEGLIRTMVKQCVKELLMLLILLMNIHE
jgi:hypothetical protein